MTRMPSYIVPLIMTFGCLIVAAVQVWLLWGSAIPLGVPGEWVWALHDVPLISMNFAACLCSRSALSGIRVTRRPEPVPQLGRHPILVWGLAGLGGLWIWATMSTIPGPGGVNRIPFVLYYPRSSGYFTQAQQNANDLAQFLSGYRERIADSRLPENHLHQGTHPPGLTVLNRLLINACERSATLRRIALASQPQTVREAFQTLRQTEMLGRQLVPDEEIAALWLLTLLTLGCAALTVWPLFHLLRRSLSLKPPGGRPHSGRWFRRCPVFLPKSDLLYPFFAILVQWLWLESLDRNCWWRGGLVGVLMGTSLLLSLAFAPIGLILALQGIHRIWKTRQGGVTVSASAATFLGCLAYCWFAWKLNLPAIWLQNFHNHAAFYDFNERTFLSWLLVNPIELGLALGPCVSVLSIAGWWYLTRSPDKDREALVIALALWGLLWISGKNQGEAARLWVFLMPYAVWSAARGWDGFMSSLQQPRRWCLALLITQLTASLLSILRVDGFHFSDL